MNDRAAFTCSHLISLTYLAISRKLENFGVSSYFIMSGAKCRTRYLMEHGVDAGHILDLSKSPEIIDEQALSAIDKYSEVRLSYIILADRLLSGAKPEKAKAYLSGVYHSVRNFIIKNDINIVFSEGCWAFELVACAVCREMGVPFVVPRSVRVPAFRFGFFEGIFQHSLAPVASGAGNFVCANDYYMRADKNVGAKTDFRKLIHHTVSFLKGDNRDATTEDVFRLGYKRMVRRLNILRSGFKSMPVSVEGRYVLFTLHCQPELSIDVVAGFFSDQLALIKAVSRSLPYGYKLAVKEHPLGVGDRTPEFFRQVRELPNTLLMSPYADTRALIKKASVVVSAAGTSCYEAALCGVGSVVFSDLFFCDLPNVIRCDSFDKLGNCLEQAIASDYDSVRTYEFIKDVLGKSYHGCVESAGIYPQAADEKNALAAAKAFKDVIDYYSSGVSKTIAASMSSR